ncbi:hypothetical protein GGR54DRAFT_636244 [Hypoxylon sp. NC1633]|nr:hypothetical protein GGR54DRAFT_636244 [Hypoxylon sp. NC1633]
MSDTYTTKGRRGNAGSNAGIPVLRDNDKIEDSINPKDADSDKQLKRDDTEAIDKSNVLKDRTRGEKPTSSYEEPTDEDFGLTEGS